VDGTARHTVTRMLAGDPELPGFVLDQEPVWRP
jgi:hypothetical protein